MEVAEVRQMRALAEENGRLRALGGGSLGAKSDLERGERKRMVSPSSKRRAVRRGAEEGWGRRARKVRQV